MKIFLITISLFISLYANPSSDWIKNTFLEMYKIDTTQSCQNESVSSGIAEFCVYKETRDEKYIYTIVKIKNNMKTQFIKKSVNCSLRSKNKYIILEESNNKKECFVFNETNLIHFEPNYFINKETIAVTSNSYKVYTTKPSFVYIISTVKLNK